MVTNWVPVKPYKNAKRTIGIVAVSLALTAWLIACRTRNEMRRPSARGETGTGAWWEQAARLLPAHCGDAIALLNRTKAHDEPRWYWLMSQAQSECAVRNQDPALRRAAVDTLDQGLISFPKSAYLQWCKARLLRALGSNDESERWLLTARTTANEIITNDPGGTAATDARHVIEGIDRFEHGARNSRTDPRLTQDLHAFLAAKRCDDAIKRVSEVPGAPNDPETALLLAEAYLQCFALKNDSSYQDRAFATLAQGLTRWPHATRLLLARARAFDQTGQHELALQAYQDAKRQALANMASDQTGAATDEHHLVDEIDRRLAAEASRRNK